MIDLILVILVSSFFVLGGWYLTYLLVSSEWVERVGLAFLLGSGFTTFLWFLGYLLGLPFSLATLLLAGIVLSLIGYGCQKLFALKIVSLVTKPFTKLELKLAISVLALLIIALLIGNYNPLTAWDSIALYDFRAHAIALNHDLRDITSTSYYVSYPLMISLMHSVVYMLGGTSAQGLHAIYFMSLIAIIYGRMRTWSNTKYALITCLMVILQNEVFSHSTFAYTNLPYTIYLVAGLLYGANPSLIVAGFLIALSTWMRSSEVFWMIGLLLIVFQSIKTKKYLVGIFMVAFVFAIRITWSRYVGEVLMSIGQAVPPRINYFTYSALNQIIVNKMDIFKYLYRFVVYPYIGFWFLTVPVAFIAIAKRNLRLFLLLSTIIVTAAMVIVGVMIFSTYYETWNEIGDSARRMILYIIPLTLVTSSYALYLTEIKKPYDK